jgi:DeoR family transcriptional regulator of aga operon
MTLQASEHIEVMMTGGTLRKKSMSFYGRQAEEHLERLRFDKFFLGVDGIDELSGITTHFEQEASLNRVMCKSARQVIAVTDSSKFNRSGFHIITAFDQIDILITDSNIPEQFKTLLEQAGVELILVPA